MILWQDRILSNEGAEVLLPHPRGSELRSNSLLTFEKFTSHRTLITAATLRACQHRPSDADKKSLNVKTTERHFPHSNASCHEPPLRQNGSSLTRKPRRTHAQFDESGNIEVVAVGSNEIEDDNCSQRKQHDDIDKVRANSISEDRKGNVEVVITGAKSKTIELINAWSHRTTRNTPRFNGIRQPRKGNWEKGRETPTMSNVSLSRSSSGHIKISDITRGHHTFGEPRQSKFKNQSDFDEPERQDSISVDQTSVPEDDVSDYRESIQNTHSNSGAMDQWHRDRRNVNERVGAHAAPVVLPDEQHGEKTELTLPLQNPAYSRIRSNSINQIRQRIDRRNTPSRNRLSIDPCASSDVASNRRGVQARVEKRNVCASETSVPSIPSSLKIRADPPSIKDLAQLQSELIVSTSDNPTSMLSKGSKTVGIHQGGHLEFSKF